MFKPYKNSCRSKEKPIHPALPALRVYCLRLEGLASVLLLVRVLGGYLLSLAVMQYA